MHAPHGPTPGTTETTRPAAGRAEGRAEGRASLPRLTLRRGSAAGGSARTADAPAAGAATRRGNVRSPADLVDTTEDGGDVDWRAVGVFGAGLVLGALLGAGTALLVAPASGFETRMRLVRGARRAGERATDRWDDLEAGLRSRARRSRKNLERKLTVARWRAQDAWERKRYGR